MTYREMFLNVIANDHLVQSRHGPCYEILGQTYAFNSLARPVRTNMQRALGYMELTQLLAGVYNLEALVRVAPNADHSLFTPHMAYGPRLRHQMEDVIHALRDDPLTRQAVLFIGNSGDGPTSALPCTETIQFLVRDGRLGTIVGMRSWDAIKGLPYDCVMFGGLTQAVARCLNVEPGVVFVHAGSIHVYLSDLAFDRRPTDEVMNYRLNLDDQYGWTDIRNMAMEQIEAPHWSRGVPSYITEDRQADISEVL